MIGDAAVLALIPARGGSKRLPGKNVADVAGRPLIAWTVDAARAVSSVDRVVVSSDDDAILAAATAAGAEAPFRRPAALATDSATSADVLMHALDSLDQPFGFAVLLQPTSPLRTAADIDGCLQLCARTGAPSAVSVSVAHPHPAWCYLRDGAGRLHALGAAEPDAEVLALNGAVYAVHVEWFRANRRFVAEGTMGYVMPPDRSVDIDEPIDLEIARLRLSGVRAF
jgi:CMP-N,N'-diacetyllegionaminic acid synthase